jgi:hypothetical protein
MARRFWESGTLAGFSLLLAAPATPQGCDAGGGGGTAGTSGTAGSGAQPGVCGDGKAEGWLESWEDCDGADLRGSTCSAVHWQYVGGTLRCAADCEFDTSDCISPVCGDGKVEGAEECDGSNLGRFRTCTEAYQNALAGVLTCGADCRYDTSACRFPVCGDGVIEGYEECEGSDLGQHAGKTCVDLRFGTSILLVPVNYQSGTLGCRDCWVDRGACVPAPGCYLTIAPKVPPIFCL